MLNKEMPSFWRQRCLLSYLLLPLAGVFALLTAIRRQVYRLRLRRIYRAPVPVIVVGNITVGGSGKTPLVIALVKAFTAAGIQVGVISRGYGGKAKTITEVKSAPDADIVGDEALLIYQQTAVPVVVGACRSSAATALLQSYPQTQILISDDGLQHYALARDIEIAVIAPDFHFGNGFLLPAGPLRELPARLKQVTMTVNAGTTRYCRLNFDLDYYSRGIRPLNGKDIQPLEVLPNQSYYALTAIARSERFFNSLHQAGIALADTRSLPDHAALPVSAAEFSANGQLLISEKDAVKTRHWPDDLRQRTLVVDYQAQLPPAMWQAIQQQLSLKNNEPAA